MDLTNSLLTIPTLVIAYEPPMILRFHGQKENLVLADHDTLQSTIDSLDDITTFQSQNMNKVEP